MQKITSNQ